ncbi:peptide ABC transporter substrate-binding protein [Bifidobacterium choloepi]|uniref:ABC transporter substrate-binding protein n=1 Tax=Bifidobacterium choloepi TaxID=2614131 RepID=A0A6I5MZL8_9BIFI|nr:ABC transporter substrate-binding protein [Bifidobacterium choloepi]NEG70098.1 ABC transporter substrate-binding protein [Bifidobacterium choloepi]
MKKKAVALVAAVAALGMGLAGCGSSSSSSSDDGIITAYGSEPQNPLIPGNTNETGGGQVIDLLFSRLVSFKADGTAQNEVAESITPNSDATVYTIKIKDGWKFTDGTDVTAESFTKAWSYTANVTNAQLNASFFSGIEGYDDLQKDGVASDAQLSGLKVVDDHTFTVTLTSPDSAFPVEIGYSAFSPLPESFYKDPSAFGESPVGNGPYKFVSWDHNSQIVLTKNDDYAGNNVAKNNGVTFKIYTDTESAYADVQAGNLDVMNTVPTSATKTFESDSSVNAYNKAGSVIQTFTIPCSLEHFVCGTEEGNYRRQAISMAIDRQSIVDKVLGGVATVATDFTSPVIDGYSKDLTGADNLKYDADKAKELWAKADAISKYDGGLTFTYNSDGGAKAVYDAIVNSINNVLDINATTNPIATFSEFRSDITDRKMTGAFRTGWQPDYPSIQNYLYPLFDSAAADGKGSNDGDFKNDDFDKLCSQAAAATSTDEAIKLYQQAEEILLEQLPAVPLYYSNADGVAAKDISGFEMNWQNVPIYTELVKS